MTTSGRQAIVRRRTVVALAVAATVILPLALPAGAQTAPATGEVVDGLLDTVEGGAGTTAGVVQQAGSGTPLQGTTNKTSATAQKTVTGTTRTLRQPASPAPNPPLGPQPAAIPAQPAPAPAPPASPMPAGPSSAGLPTLSTGSASGLRVDAATLLLARHASAMPLVAEALSASPSALVLVAEPLARSLNVAMGPTSDVATTSGRAEEVQPASHLPDGLLTEALIAVALLVAATAALVAELGLKRSSPRAT
ncbi:MAG: hypothetical protein M3O70_21045 [Actinomycetota bacterium]|nr:hypothetical protein [Actinomycetota bacterium]